MSSDTKIKKLRSGKKLNKITFETEIITKDTAKQRLQEKELVESLITPSKKQKQKVGSLEEKEPLVTNVSTKPKKRKVEKKQKGDGEPETNLADQTTNSQVQNSVEDAAKPEIQKGDSKRAKKRKKHEQLLLDKKVKVDLETREKCLNYLSRWKHNNNDWKFEKLRQVWLQQNMFDSDKVPDKCWETVLEYFENSKGNIRQKIIDEALKVIEQEEHSNANAEDVEMNNNHITLKRAKDIIQYLQT